MKSMALKKRLLRKSRLYAIINRETVSSGNLPRQTIQLRDAGVHIIQLRDKVSPKTTVIESALFLRKLLSGYPVLFIINDYVDIAALIDSDGVHLGQSDTSLTTCRKILGKNKLIGITCTTLAQATKAQEEGADYLGIGPIYTTKTKQDAGLPIGIECIPHLREMIHIPFFVIGGITARNIIDLKKQGVRNFALCTALNKGKSVKTATQDILDLLTPHQPRMAGRCGVSPRGSN